MLGLQPEKGFSTLTRPLEIINSSTNIFSLYQRHSTLTTATLEKQTKPLKWPLNTNMTSKPWFEMELLKQRWVRMVQTPFIPPCHQNFLTAVMFPARVCQAWSFALGSWKNGWHHWFKVSLTRGQTAPTTVRFANKLSQRHWHHSGSHFYGHTHSQQRPWPKLSRCTRSKSNHTQ